jgi:hypothetical protein
MGTGNPEMSTARPTVVWRCRVGFPVARHAGGGWTAGPRFCDYGEVNESSEGRDSPEEEWAKVPKGKLDKDKTD